MITTQTTFPLLTDKALSDHVKGIETLRSQHGKLLRAMEYIETSTRPDGQWADQAVNSFVLATIANVKA